MGKSIKNKIRKAENDLNRALDEYSEAVMRGDDERAEELSDLICTLEAKLDWLML